MLLKIWKLFMYSSYISTVVCFLAVQCPFLLVSLNLPFSTSSKTTDMNHREQCKSMSLGLRRLFPGTRPTAAASIYCAFVTASDTDGAPWALLILGLTCAFPRAAHFPTYTTKGANWSPPQDSFFLSLSFYNSTVISASFPSPSHNLILFIILFKNQYWMTTFIFHTIYSLSRTTKTGFHYSAFLKSDFQSIKHFLISLCEFWGPEWWIRNLLMSVCFYGKLLKYTQINIFELIQCFQWLSMRQVFFHFWYFFMMGTYHYQHLFKHIQLSQTQTLYTTVPPLWFSFVNYNASSAKKLIVSTVVNKTEFNFISFFFLI